MSAVSAAVLLLSAALAVPATDPGTIDPPREGASIRVITVTGTGCAAGNAAPALSPDNATILVSFGAYAASAGPGVRATDFRKNCLVALYLDAPTSDGYAIDRADYRGLAHLATGASASMLGQFYLAGYVTTPRYSHSISGPFDGAWHATFEIPPADLAWYGCGTERGINIDTELRATKGTADPQATTGISFLPADQGAAVTVHLRWRTCQ